MPFGLAKAPPTFARLLERVVFGLQWQVCLIYLDNIIIFGKTVIEEIDNLSRVLDRLRAAEMSSILTSKMATHWTRKGCLQYANGQSQSIRSRLEVSSA